MMERKLKLMFIPKSIGHICLFYYFHDEYWSRAGDDLEISSNRRTVTKTASNRLNWRNTAYGNLWIESTIDQRVKWKFGVNHLNDNETSRKCNNFIICLVSRDDRLNHTACPYGDGKPNYAFANNDGTIINGENFMEIHSTHSRFVEGDEVSLILNTSSLGRIFRQRNEEEPVLIFKNLKKGKDILYKIAISLYAQKDSLSLVDFQCER